MSSHFSVDATAAAAGELRCEKSVEIASAQLTLLEHLEVSLQITQKALLARDLSALEQGTTEQMRLCRALEILPRRTAVPAQNGDPLQGALELRPEAELSAALQAAQARVLHLGRVQAALLVRAQRSLHMIANLLAGPQASYTPPPTTARPRLSWTGDREREEQGCRV